MYKLVISDDEGRTTVVPLVRDEITIGREEGNTIRLTERNVSRKHARLSRVDGRFVLEDLGSYNGIKVNGSRMGTESDLGAGDQIVIGDYRIALESEQTEVASGEMDISLSGAHDLVPPARLVMLSQPAPGAEFALSKDEICIGREEVMDVWVNHRSISREHAKITRKVQRADADTGQHEVNTFQIHDLDSANGVRVNGQEVFEAALKQGDIVELGQVRFRYVELGEVFSFESGESAAFVPGGAAAAEEEEEEREGLPIIAAVLILGAAIGLAAAIATSGSGGADRNTDPAPRPTPVMVQPDTREDAGAALRSPTDAQRQEAQAALESCHDGLDTGNLEAALAGAERALVLVPGIEGAEECKLYAAQLIADMEIFARGKAQLEANDIDSAYFTMEQLSAESELRAEAEFAAAKLAFARHHVGLAREALADNPEEAANQAQMVIQTPDVPRAVIVDAQRILTVAQRRMAAAGRSEGTAPGSDEGPTRREPTPTATPTPPPTPVPGTDDRSPMDQARDCMRAGDNACVVAALEGGRARSAASLSLLIETYRQMGNQEAATRHMRTFVTRYPDDRRAANYSSALGN